MNFTKLQQFLNETKVEDIAPPLSQDFVLLKTTQTIYEALQTLSNNRVSSAPVLDEKGVAIGMCSVLDILVFIMQCFNLEIESTKVNANEEIEHIEHTHIDSNPFEMLSKGSDISKRPLSDLMWNQTSIDSYVVLNQGTTLEEALPEFADGVHRCAIMSQDNMKLVSILSQSAIVKRLASQPELLGEEGKIPLHDLAIGTSPVISASMSDLTINVFAKMAQNAVSGIAIVDHSGAVLGNISAMDIAACEKNNLYGSLRKDARSFIQKIQSYKINISNPAIAVYEESTLETVINHLAFNRIHRVYVCDHKGKPIRVISLRDILEYIYDSTDTEGTISEDIQVRSYE